MYIKFGDTSGNIFDPIQSKTNEYELGSMVILSDGIIIYDREPSQRSSQLILDHIIESLKYAIKTSPAILTSNEVIIYLPRMSLNLNEQVQIQHTFQTLTTIDTSMFECTAKRVYTGDKKKRNLINIKIIHM